MDYEKLPKIDMNEIDKSEFKNIFYCEYGNTLMKHYINYQGNDIRIGTSQITVHDRQKVIEWNIFYPFQQVLSKEEIINKMCEESINCKELNDIERIEKEYPEAKKYAIIDTLSSRINRIVEPAAFITNYDRKGIGTLAHTQIIEQLHKLYENKIDEYKVMHMTADKQRLKQLNAIGINYAKPGRRLKEIQGIDTSETFIKYMQKSKDYLKSRGIY